MKQKLSILLSIIFLMPIFAMSDGDSNGIGSDSKAKLPQKDYPLPIQPEQVDSNGIVTDRLGYNTGMTKDELQKFKEDYNNLDKTMFPGTHSTMLYDAKIDLNKYEELKILGVDLTNSGGFTESKDYLENSLYGEIVVVGKTIEKEKVNGADTFRIEIFEVLKGAEILKFKLGKVPKFFNYFDPFNQEPVMDMKGLYFFGFAQDINKDTRCWVQQIPASTLLCLEDNSIVYEKNFKSLNYALYFINNATTNEKMIKSEKWRKKIHDLYESVKMNESWDVAISSVRQILEINDAENFYKKTWRKK
ncbi:MAG: hypothetical protein JXR34_11705 [Bacteroidales bacterium]|nr:hypothetical protein [Bacteroidales bacterium]